MQLDPRREKLLRLTFLDYQQGAAFLDHPLVIDRAEGLHYWDSAGKRYFDAIGGIFVATLGHRHPRLIAALERPMAAPVPASVMPCFSTILTSTNSSNGGIPIT